MAATPKPMQTPAQPSKEAVNRAGRLIADLLVEYRNGNREQVDQMQREEPVGDAFDLIDWWRSLHAKPLTSVKNWDIQRTRDYAAEPKASGYRAVHVIVRRKGRLIEVQLRTPTQDAWANQVEEDSRRVGRNFKGGQGQGEVHEYYVVVSELLAFREQGMEPDDDLRHRLLRTYKAAQPFLTTASGGNR